MEQEFVIYADAVFEGIKKSMVELGHEEMLPMVVLNPGSGENEALLALYWEDQEQKAKVLQLLVETVKEGKIQTVMVFGVALGLVPSLGDEKHKILFVDIHRQGERPFTIAQTFLKVAGEVVFGDKMTSAAHYISTLQIPPLWSENENL